MVAAVTVVAAMVAVLGTYTMMAAESRHGRGDRAGRSQTHDKGT